MRWRSGRLSAAAPPSPTSLILWSCLTACTILYNLFKYELGYLPAGKINNQLGLLLPIYSEISPSSLSWFELYYIYSGIASFWIFLIISAFFLPHFSPLFICPPSLSSASSYLFLLTSLNFSFLFSSSFTI